MKFIGFQRERGKRTIDYVVIINNLRSERKKINIDKGKKYVNKSNN